MSLGRFSAMFAGAVAALGVAAHEMHLPGYWVAIGIVMLSNLLILSGASPSGKMD